VNDIYPTKNSIMLEVVLSASGTVYGAVYRSNSTVSNSPSSADAVILQNIVGVIRGNITILTIKGLDAATFYNIYLLTVSSAGMKMTLDHVLNSRIDVKNL
jgi:hypothetical protein